MSNFTKLPYAFHLEQFLNSNGKWIIIGVAVLSTLIFGATTLRHEMKKNSAQEGTSQKKRKRRVKNMMSNVL